MTEFAIQPGPADLDIVRLSYRLEVHREAA